MLVISRNKTLNFEKKKQPEIRKDSQNLNTCRVLLQSIPLTPKPDTQSYGLRRHVTDSYTSDPKYTG